MELEKSANIKPTVDSLPALPELPEVHVVAVEDVTLQARAGIETELDAFYVGVIGLVRLEDQLAYRADNVRICFDVVEPPVLRDSYRSIGLWVMSLETLAKELNDREIEFTYTRDGNAAEAILLRDPAGNWMQIAEHRRI